MKRYAIMIGALAALALGSGCATGYYDDGYYYAGTSYSPDCDYYTPPWGYPSDYCRYRIWNQPVYYGGVWFDGPIYYRTNAGMNWFWLNGDWRRDEWRGSARPRIAANDRRNQFWRGEIIHRAREEGQHRDVGRGPLPRGMDGPRPRGDGNRGRDDGRS